MKKLSKRLKKCLEAIEKDKDYELQEAITLLKNAPHPKFDETVEIVCTLNIDPKQSEQIVRGTTVLPHGIGKEVKVCVFCKGEDVVKAKNAGADFAGANELVEKIKKGWLEFDKTASTPEMMKEVAQLGKLLGPRGLMPSPKAGTVGPDIAAIVKELKAGKVQFKTDKTANLHAAIGKLSFPEKNIYENAQTLIKAVLHARPASIKGRYMKKISISSTMGPGIKLDLAKLGAAR
ncbi:MAG: 50S ribosomal protein L1 [Candidatus Omnitrophica bacterium]|nr:50S ribosomal protein L1 [Candidatus Omnitrophota bacterium]